MRLIDADEIVLTDFEIVMCNGDYKEALKMLIDKISNQPTAYDIGEVVEELKQEIQNGTIKIEAGNSRLFEIVKQGGADDDVCEWKLCDEESNVYDTSCRNLHILIEGTPRENNYEFCPYCGKKIKIAGD